MLRHRLVAHRGYQRKYPENTLLAMAEAIEAGALFVETDIQFTRDLVPVLYHDAFLARISGVEGHIYELSGEQARQLPAHEPFRLGERYETETVATLDALVALLRAHPGVTGFIEAKEEAIARVGTETAFKILSSALQPLAQQAVLISFDVNFIAHARRNGFANVGLVIKDWHQIDAGATLSIAPDYIFTSADIIPEGKDLSRFTPLIVVYEIDQAETAAELFAQGADMVETFDIGGMIASLSTHSL